MLRPVKDYVNILLNDNCSKEAMFTLLVTILNDIQDTVVEKHEQDPSKTLDDYLFETINEAIDVWKEIAKKTKCVSPDGLKNWLVYKMEIDEELIDMYRRKND